MDQGVEVKGLFTEVTLNGRAAGFALAAEASIARPTASAADPPSRDV